MDKRLALTEKIRILDETLENIKQNKLDNQTMDNVITFLFAHKSMLITKQKAQSRISPEKRREYTRKHRAKIAAQKEIEKMFE